LVYPPGETPPDDGKPLGIWKLVEGEFPPRKKEIAGPKKVIVYPETKKPEQSAKPIGIWSYPPGVPRLEDDQWEPQEIVAYPPGQKPDDFGKEGAHGIWGYAPGAKPKDDGVFDPKDIRVYPSGAIPPENHEWADDDPWKPAGVWTMTPTAKWPPSKARAPEPKIIRTLPEAKRPENASKPYGIWSYVGAKPENDDNWKPVDIMVHAPGHDPEVLDESKPHGVWKYAQGFQPEDGKFDPKNIQVFAPGQNPKEDGRPRGVWTYDGRWPPPVEEPKVVIVYPKAKKPKTSSKPMGAWTYPEGTKPERDDDWDPMKVLAHPPGQTPSDLDKSKPHGIWGYAPGSKPNALGEFDPKDLLVLPPGATPPDDENWKPRGVWTALRLDVSWPPKSEPKEVTVYPKSKKPEPLDKKRLGVWSYPTGVPTLDDKGWKPQNIMAYPPGQKPDNMGEGPHGHWSYYPGKEPEDGDAFDPKDIRVFPPGASPPEDHVWADDDPWKPHGVWTMKPGEEWPPKKKPELPKKVIVFPKAKKPETFPKPMGVWTYPTGVPLLQDENWNPEEVMAYPPGQKPDDLGSGPHGHWAYKVGAKPNDDGEFDPKDIRVFPPGASPPEDHEWADDDPYKPEGVWTMPPKKQWPPLPPKPKEIMVYPKSKKPTTSTGAVGCWRHAADKPEKDDDWETQKNCCIFQRERTKGLRSRAQWHLGISCICPT
jgi:hypothetical protein